MEDRVGVSPVLLAEFQLLRARLAEAQQAGRGLNLHRKEVSLASAIMEAAAGAVPP